MISQNFTPCSLVDRYQRFEAIHASIFKDVFSLKEQAKFPSSESLFNKLYGVASYMIVMLVLQVLDTLNTLRVCM